VEGLPEISAEFLTRMARGESFARVEVGLDEARAFQFKVAMGTKLVPPQFLLMLPYVFAMVVLVQIYRGAKAPRALTVPYDREARG